jgi:hypothetical protein
MAISNTSREPSAIVVNFLETAFFILLLLLNRCFPNNAE